MDHLTKKLESFTPLSDAERQVLQSAISHQRRHDTNHATLDIPATDCVTVVLAGLACRYKLMRNGRKQILGYLIAGDICSLRMSPPMRPDHHIGTFGPTQTAALSLVKILTSPERYPNLTRALLWSMLVEESICREWLANVGHRSAFERVAHLFCELYLRLQLVGLTRGAKCDLPLTQHDLADTLALSAVHVNRVLMQMRLADLVSFRSGQLTVPNLDALCVAAGFDRTYLHFRS